MQLALILNWLKSNWKLVLIAGIAAFLIGFSYQTGYKRAYNIQQAIIDKNQKEATEAKNKALQEYSVKLEEAKAQAEMYEAQSQAIGVALAEANAELVKEKQKIKKEVKYVVQKDIQESDGKCIDGFGSNSLLLYKQALGYAN